MKIRSIATLAIASLFMPLAGSAQAEPDEEELLSLIQDLQAQIDAIQLVPGPTGPAGPAGSGGGSGSFEYVGTAGLLFDGSGGLGDFSRACNFAIPGSRMCTSEEVIRTVNPPQILGASDFAWVHPITAINLADFSGVSTQGFSGQLTCDAWTRNDTEAGGLVLGLSNGSFHQFLCNTQNDVACCAPPASP